MTLTKAELCDALIDNIKSENGEKMDKALAKWMVETFFGIMVRELSEGRHIRISGFGNFLLRDKASRPGRNPKTGAVVPVAARRVVTFHPSPKLRTLVLESHAKRKF